MGFPHLVKAGTIEEVLKRHTIEQEEGQRDELKRASMHLSESHSRLTGQMALMQRMLRPLAPFAGIRAVGDNERTIGDPYDHHPVPAQGPLLSE